VNAKAKGSRAERRAIAMLNAMGYLCTKAGGSLGVFDVIALGAVDIRCIQVKSGTGRLSPLERETIRGLALPTNCTREVWRFPDRCKEPLIERLTPALWAASDPVWDGVWDGDLFRLTLAEEN